MPNKVRKRQPNKSEQKDLRGAYCLFVKRQPNKPAQEDFWRILFSSAFVIVISGHSPEYVWLVFWYEFAILEIEAFLSKTFWSQEDF